MKIRHFAALLIALLTLSLLAGCSAQAVHHDLEKAEEKIEHKLDVLEDAVEQSLRDAVTPAAPAAPAEPAAPPKPEAAPAAPAPEAAPPAAPEAASRLTPEEAQAFALDHAGFTADQVKFLRAEFEIDDRIPHYDIEFHEGHWEYEYEIHAETGAVLSFEKDD